MVSFAKILKASLKFIERPFSLPDLPSELARLEYDPLPARAGKCCIGLYPSDALLRFASALWARNLDLVIIKKPGHGNFPSPVDRVGKTVHRRFHFTSPAKARKKSA